MENLKGNHDNLGESSMESINITRPIYNYVLITFLIASLIAIFWSIFGSIPQTVEGIGEINTDSGLQRITPLYGGEIKKINVKRNDTVNSGDVLFTIDRSQISGDIEQLKVSIKQLEERKILISSGNNNSTSIKKQADKYGISRLKENIEEINKNLLFYETRLAQEKKLYEKGLITYSQYVISETNYSSLKMDKISTEEQLKLISLNKEETDFGNNLTVKEISNQISILEVQLKNLIKQYKLESEVTAKASGIVRQVNVKIGTSVSTDYVLTLLDSDSGNLSNYIVNVYIPSSSNQVVKKGMVVDVEPVNIDKNLYGWLEGKITEVSQFPESNSGFLITLSNENLIDELDNRGTYYKLEVKLDLDPKTFSGFKWTNKKGPRVKIYPGQLAKAFVHVKNKAPIDYVLPIFNKYFN